MSKQEEFLRKIVNGRFVRKEKHEKEFKKKERLEALISDMLDKYTKGHYGDCVLVKEIDTFAKMITAKILTEFIVIIDEGVI